MEKTNVPGFVKDGHVIKNTNLGELEILKAQRKKIAQEKDINRRLSAIEERLGRLERSLATRD